MSDANTSTLAFKPETVLGVPDAGPFQQVRFTGEGLKNTKETAPSLEIRDDRQTSYLAKVGEQPEGNFNFELSWLGQQYFIASVLQANWITLNEVVADVDIDHTAQTATGVAGDFNDIPIGSLVKIVGAVTALNNGKKRVIGKSLDGSTLTFGPGSFTATEANADLTLTGKTISNDKIRKSMTFEKGILNTSNVRFYQLYHGMVADTMELNLESKKVVTGSFSFIGTKPGLGAAQFDAGTYVKPPTGDILNGTSNMGVIVMDGAAAQDKFRTLKLNIANNLRGKDALGELGNFDIGMGTIGVTGNLGAYFRNNDLPTKIQAHTSFSLEFGLVDATGRTLHFYLPNVKPANGDPVISGINTDVMIETDWQAILDDVTGKTIIIDVHE